MNWIKQMFCDHQIESKEHEITVHQLLGGYIWHTQKFVTTLFCKKCGYSKKIVS